MGSYRHSLASIGGVTMKLIILFIFLVMMLQLLQAAPQNNNGGYQAPGRDCGVDSTLLECLREVIPGEPKQDYPIYGQSLICKFNRARLSGRAYAICPRWRK